MLVHHPASVFADFHQDVVGAQSLRRSRHRQSHQSIRQCLPERTQRVFVRTAQDHEDARIPDAELHTLLTDGLSVPGAVGQQQQSVAHVLLVQAHRPLECRGVDHQFIHRSRHLKVASGARGIVHNEGLDRRLN